MTNRTMPLDRLRRQVDGLLSDDPGPSGAVRRGGPAQGSFEIALNPFEKAGVKAAMAATGADRRFDATVRGLLGGQISGRELDSLKERALDKATPKDILLLQGIQAGVPVEVTPAQKTAIDRLVGQLGGDPLGEKARKSYEGAVRGGNIRVG